MFFLILIISVPYQSISEINQTIKNFDFEGHGIS